MIFSLVSSNIIKPYEIQNTSPWNSLVPQELELHIFTAKDTDSTPGGGTFFPQTTWFGQKKKKKISKPHNKTFSLFLETVSPYKKFKPMLIQLILDNRNPVQLEKKAKFMVQCNDAEEVDAGHEEVVDYFKDFCLELKMTKQP